MEFCDEKIDYAAIHRGETLAEKNISFIPFMGKRFYDLMIPASPYPLLISQRVIDIFKLEGITGWEATPVKVLGHEDLNYSVLTVLGRCGKINQRGERVSIMYPNGSIAKLTPAYKGWSFDINSWGGSDIFLPANNHTILVTKKVRDILVRNKATNILLRKISDIIVPEAILDFLDKM